jgi:hypothetical protein
VQGEPGAIDASYTRLYRWIADHALATDPDAWSLERYDQRRQKVTPPYLRFDYDIFTACAETAATRRP